MSGLSTLPRDPKVSFVVVTMNRREEVLECLLSIDAQDYGDKEIIVVDNGSRDGTPAAIRERLPGVILIELPKNVGAAAGRNRGVARASGDICVFIDDDARVGDTQMARKVVEKFRADPRLGCIACRIVDPKTGREDVKAIPRMDKRISAEDYECSYFCGAGFAMRRDVYNRCGGFWELLFYSVEELEFSYRILASGYGIRYTPDISIEHKEVPKARPKGQWVYFQVRNRFWVAMRHLPWRYVFLTTALWWSWCGVIAFRRRHLIPYFQAIRDALAGLSGVLRERHALDAVTIRKLRALSGRVLY